MNIEDFPNPKLNLPKEFKNSQRETIRVSFAAVENYLHSVNIYVYTNINLNYQRSDPNHIHSWIQRIVSSIVLRSLYLRNNFVDEFNVRNIVGIFLPLKAWIETVGVLASILNLLEKNLSPEELYKELQPYILGNRGEGSLRVGKFEARSVTTIIEKADKYFKKISKESTNASASEDTNNFFTDFYDIPSNLSHPSFDAYELVSFLQDDGVWKVKEPSEIKKMIVDDIDYYGGLLMSPLFVKNICEKIFKIEAEYFNKLESQKYFN